MRRKIIFMSSVISYLLLITQLVSAQVTPEDLFEEVPESSLSNEQSTRLARIRERATTDAIRIVQIQQLSRLLQNETIALNLFPGQRYQAARTSLKQRSDTDFSWIGEIPNQLGSVILVRKGEDLTGTVRVNDELYRIEPLRGGPHVIIRVDQAGFPPEHPEEYPDGALNSNNALQRPSRNSTVSSLKSDATTTLSSNTPIDVLVAYTPSAASAAGNISGLIQTAEDETNVSYQNSNVDITLNVVYEREVNYTESGSFSTDLDRFLKVADGYMDEIHDWRDQSGADVCVLLINDAQKCGLAAAIPANESFEAFCVVHYDCATGKYSFGHEIGHLQGARHQFQKDNEVVPFPYGHGYIFGSKPWSTIMAILVPNRVQHWSNPAVFFNGFATGEPDTANNARVLNETASTISGFRSPPPPPPAPQNFVITNAMSIGQNPHMTWDASAGATSYNVYRRPSNETNWTKIATTQSTSYTDNTITITKPSDPNAVEFFYHATAVNNNGESGPSNSYSIWGTGLYKPTTATMPAEFKLEQNYPNPFNPETTINYELPTTVKVKLKIFDLLGREVRTLVNQVQPAGQHQARWDGKDNEGRDIPSGIYLVRIESAEFVKVRKMTLLR